MTRLASLLGPDAEDRPEQNRYAASLLAGFAPREEAGLPEAVLAEAGTGIGKILGYIAPASLCHRQDDLPPGNGSSACRPLPVGNQNDPAAPGLRFLDIRHRLTALPDPELYIIVNGKPTKSKIVWRSLVNVAHINAAVHKLK